MIRRPPRSTLFPLHDALPISRQRSDLDNQLALFPCHVFFRRINEDLIILMTGENAAPNEQNDRSEEHTSELQSLAYLVCRLLLEKKKKKIKNNHDITIRT